MVVPDCQKFATPMKVLIYIRADIRADIAYADPTKFIDAEAISFNHAVLGMDEKEAYELGAATLPDPDDDESVYNDYVVEVKPAVKAVQTSFPLAYFLGLILITFKVQDPADLTWFSFVTSWPWWLVTMPFWATMAYGTLHFLWVWATSKPVPVDPDHP